MRLGLYCVARYKRDEKDAEREFVEYGAPFVEVNDDSACFAVREAVKDVKDKIDLSLFSLFKVGEFYPDDQDCPFTGDSDHYFDTEVVVEDCSVLFEVIVNE